jgi:phosphoglycerate dehydrogenase-like enzyme
VFTNNEQKVLQALRSRPDATLRQIIDATGLARSSSFVALTRLVELGLVLQSGAGGPRSAATHRVAPRHIIDAAALRMADEVRKAALSDAPDVEKPVLVFTDSYVLPDDALRRLRSRYQVVVHDSSPAFMTDELFAERISGAQVAVRYDAPMVDAECLRRAPRLKTIVCATTNVRNVDFTACAERGVEVLSLDPAGQSRYSFDSQAEYVLNAVTTLLNPLEQAANRVRTGDGFRHAAEPASDLAGSNVGVVIAQADASKLVKMLQMLGCNVAAANTMEVPRSAMSMGLTGYTSISELWDWASIAVVLGGARFDLTDYLRSPRMPSYLIICADRVTYDLQVMREQLLSGRLKGLVLDVLPEMFTHRTFDKHPQQALRPIVNLPNVYVTPELSVRSRGAMRRNNEAVLDVLMNLSFT